MTKKTEETVKKLSMAEILEKYKKGSKEASTVMLLSPEEFNRDFPSLSTGILSVDKICGIGGLPKGRIIEIFGNEMSGKTTLCLQIIAAAQKAGGRCLFVDAEHALDTSLAKSLGVDVNNLGINQPDCGEEALELVVKFCELFGDGDVIVVDSVAALTPRAEIEGDVGDSHMGLQARMMSQGMRKLAGVVSKSGVIVILINQIRQKIGIVFGNPEVTTGGNALKFYASVRLEMRKHAVIKKGETIIGSEVSIKAVKNKVAPPFKMVNTQLIFGKGIPRVRDIFNLAIEAEIVEKSGAWFSYQGAQLGQGFDKSLEVLENDPKMVEFIEQKLREIFKI